MTSVPTSSRTMPRAVIVLAAVMGVLLGGTIVLWAHYGTTVFFEAVRAGIAMCF